MRLCQRADPLYGACPKAHLAPDRGVLAVESRSARSARSTVRWWRAAAAWLSSSAAIAVLERFDAVDDPDQVQPDGLVHLDEPLAALILGRVGASRARASLVWPAGASARRPHRWPSRWRGIRCASWDGAASSRVRAWPWRSRRRGPRYP